MAGKLDTVTRPRWQAPRVDRAKDVLLRVLGFNLRAYMKAKVALSTATN